MKLFVWLHWVLDSDCKPSSYRWEAPCPGNDTNELRRSFLSKYTLYTFVGYFWLYLVLKRLFIMTDTQSTANEAYAAIQLIALYLEE